MRRLLKDAPDDALAWAYKVRLDVDAGQFPLAVAAGLQSLALNGSLPHAWSALAVMFSALQDGDMALRCFQTALVADPDYAGTPSLFLCLVVCGSDRCVAIMCPGGSPWLSVAWVHLAALWQRRHSALHVNACLEEVVARTRPWRCAGFF